MSPFSSIPIFVTPNEKSFPAGAILLCIAFSTSISTTSPVVDPQYKYSSYGPMVTFVKFLLKFSKLTARLFIFLFC